VDNQHEKVEIKEFQVFQDFDVLDVVCGRSQIAVISKPIEKKEE
jgi:hypothetical protein